MKYADLHIHSTASDGSWTPGEIVSRAKNAGFYCIAIADHDTVSGVEEALKAGEEQGIEVIPALEFSTIYRGGEVHVLGYCIDWKDTALLSELKNVSESRLNRAKKMVEKLQEIAPGIAWEDVKEKAAGESVGRPHIASVLLDKGHIDSISEAFTGDYIGKGGRAYVERYKMTPERAIQLTKESGGVPVLAHPGFFRNDARLEREDIEYLVEHGLQGIEVWHTEHTEEDIAYYEKIAGDLGLLVTGGSDCHGENKNEILLGRIKLPYEHVEKLKKKGAPAGS